MQLTQHTDFALRLLIVLARKGGGPVSVPGFAAEQGLSSHHVAKVAQALVHEGFARSLRGRGGGIVLARSAGEIGIGQVVRAMERGMKLADCARCVLRFDCALSSLLAEALEAFLAVLDRATLADAARGGVPAFPSWAIDTGTCAVPGD